MASEVIGRSVELGALESFLGAVPTGPSAFILRGEAGIGKTALWETGTESARRRNIRVLIGRAAEAEAALSFSALADLLEQVDEDILSSLPGPQRTALEIALLRVDPHGRAPQPRAIGAGLLQVMRALAERTPVIVAIDDVHWLDQASSDAVAFAVRRLGPLPVGLLLTERSGHTYALRRTLGALDPMRIDMTGLSFGAARQLVGDRLGLRLPRRTMRRVLATTGGNPLFMLEVGRALVGRESISSDDDLPMPSDVEDLIGVRVDNLDPAVRRAVLAVALAGDLRVQQLSAIADTGPLDDAIRTGLLAVEGDQVRMFHPLLAPVVRDRTSARERRALHLDLARTIPDDARAARHMALAAVGADEPLAAALSSAASAAAARGARTEAVELAGHALRLSASDSNHRSARLLALAEMFERAGEMTQSRAVIEPALMHFPPGPVRALGHLLMLNGSPSIEDHDYHLDRALAESDGDAVLRARVLAEKALDTAVFYVRRLPEAEEWATEAVSLDPSAESLAAAGWCRILGGQPADDLLTAERSGELTPPEVYYSGERLVAVRAAFRGEAAVARQTFERLLRLADDRGEASSYVTIVQQLAELELRCGELSDARRLIDELDLLMEDGVGTHAHAPRLRALLAALTGEPDEVALWADLAMKAAAETGNSPANPTWDVLEIQRARGLTALMSGEPRAAADIFGMVWSHTEREGIHDPGAFPVAPDLVEALVSQGDLSAAHETTARLREVTECQDHPWGRASVLRCRALLQISSDVPDGDPVTALVDATEAYAGAGLRFDAARSLSLGGLAARRQRRWGLARGLLARAHEAFEAIGSTGWAARVRSDLERLGDRTASAGNGLTRSELRVAQLAAEGLSNKEIAGALFVGEHTVEVHLSHAYAKLGIRSRAGLARRLVERP